jgi:hypothetical protein
MFKPLCHRPVYSMHPSFLDLSGLFWTSSKNPHLGLYGPGCMTPFAIRCTYYTGRRRNDATVRAQAGALVPPHAGAARLVRALPRAGPRLVPPSEESRQVGPDVGPTSALYSCIPAGMTLCVPVMHLLGHANALLAPVPRGDPARRRRRGTARARSHCCFVPPLIRSIPDSLTYSVPLFLKRQCGRILGAAPPQRRPFLDRHPARAEVRGPDRRRPPGARASDPPAPRRGHRSHGRSSHSDSAWYRSLVITPTKTTKPRLNDSAAHG